MASKIGGMDEHEISGLCIRPLSPVMNTGQELSWEGVPSETSAKWEQLDSLCDQHLDAIRVRLRLVKSFNLLWVSSARTPSASTTLPPLQQSGQNELVLRLKVLNFFDDIFTGTPMPCLRRIQKCLMRLFHQWQRFHCPRGVLRALFARVWKLTMYSKLIITNFLILNAYFLFSVILATSRKSSKLLRDVVALQRNWF